jgi:hypothetical protein
LDIFCIFYWRKYKDKDWLSFIWIGIVGGLAQLIDYFLRNIFPAPGGILSIIDYFIIVFNPLAVIAIFVIIIRSFTKKNRL